jgi:hypothetical protein
MDTPHPAELCTQEFIEKAEDFVRREPAQAVAVAFGAALLLKLLPTRALVGAVTEVTVRLLPPALLTLGVIKAFEICCQKADNLTYDEDRPPPLL